MMNPATLFELERELQKVKASDFPKTSGLWKYLNLWSPLVVAFALMALWIRHEPDSSRFAIPILSIVIAVRSLYSMIQNNLNKRMRPVLEALLSVPEHLPKQEHPENLDIVKPKRARPKRR
jgi:hypothetical protein